MERGARIATAAGILLGGMALAMLFRHDASRLGAAPPDGFDHLVLRGRVEPDTPATPLSGATASAPSGASPVSPTVAGGSSNTGAAPSDAPKSVVPLPSYPNSAAPGEGCAKANLLPPKPLRHHRIIDGDTLAALAERYLGAADRASEIFELNRDILPGPGLLPIGKEIVLPPRDAPFPKTSGRASADSARSLIPLSAGR